VEFLLTQHGRWFIQHVTTRIDRSGPHPHPHPPLSNNTIILLSSGIMKLSILSFLAFAASTIHVTASMVADLGYNEEQVDDSDWKIQALIHDNDDLIHEVDAMKNEVDTLIHEVDTFKNDNDALIH
jgi:hypothetical protein